MTDLDPRTLDHDALATALLAAKPVLASKLTHACELDEAHPALREVLRFISLCAASRSALTPSPRVDAAWHEFVLCTREYAEFCTTQLGTFVHHDPGGSDEDNARQFRATLRAYVAAFGPPDPTFWGDVPTADCGGCTS